MASGLAYRFNALRTQSFKTEPLVNGVQLYPIEASDLVFVHPATNCVRSASYMLSQGANEGDNQSAFQEYFAGVAMRKTGLQPGETTARLPVSIDPGYNIIATEGVFEYPCPNGIVWQPGDLVAIFAAALLVGNTVNAAGVWAPYSQKVDKITSSNPGVPVSPAAAIGVAHLGWNQLGQTTDGYSSGQTPQFGAPFPTVFVEIFSTIMRRTLGVSSTNIGSGSGQ